MKRMTVIFEDESLYREIKMEAARRDKPLKVLVTEALRAWLEDQEDNEVLPAIETARTEWKEKGGVEAGEFFRQMKAEEKRRAV